MKQNEAEMDPILREQEKQNDGAKCNRALPKLLKNTMKKDEICRPDVIE